MRSLLCLALVFLMTASGFAEKDKEPLPDYVARFAQLDAQLRALDSTTSCTNYLAWMDAAIEAKRELKLRKEVEPWLKDLTTTHSNNWKILHAAAVGQTKVYNHWESIQLMNRAFPLARAESPPDEEIGRLYTDYIGTLLSGSSDFYELQAKTLGTPSKELSKQHQKLRKAARDAPAIIFYTLPDSYEAAANDGELIQWLIENKPAYDCGNLRDWHRADFAVLLAGAHRNLPTPYEESIQGEWIGTLPKTIHSILSNLKDNETVLWEEYGEKHWIIQLPDDYRYIRDYQNLAEQGNQQAAQTLGNIFLNRCQLARALPYYELAGDTNAVQFIRANQGHFLPHQPKPEGTALSVDYVYRNGQAATFEIYRIDAGTNLLARFISKQVMASEFNLLQGNPEHFMDLSPTNQASRIGKKVDEWTLPLSPLTDHRDAVQPVKIPNLPAGNYLLRATMKDGNRSETILHIFDTLLFSAQLHSKSPSAPLPPDPTEETEESDDLFGDLFSIIDPEESLDPFADLFPNDKSKEFYILCDAFTGKPLPKEELHFLGLSGGSHWEMGEYIDDGLLALKNYRQKTTDKNGIYLSTKKRKDEENVLARLNRAFPFASENFPSRIHIYDTNYYNDSGKWTGMPEIFTVTDRPLYRPGDTGHLKVWSPNYALEGRNHLEILSRNNGCKISLQTADGIDAGGFMHCDLFGCVDYTFTLPPDAPLGSYAVYKEFNVKDLFRVEEYRTPEFDIKAHLDGSNLVVGVNYTYGEPLRNGHISIDASFLEKEQTHWHPKAPYDFLWGNGYGWQGGQFAVDEKKDNEKNQDWNYDVRTNLNASGTFSFDVSEIKALDTPGFFNIYASATDAAHKRFGKRLTVPVTFPERNLCCWLDKAFLAPDEPIVCHIDFTHQTAPLQLEVRRMDAPDAPPLQALPVGDKKSIELAPLTRGIYTVRLASQNGSASRAFEFAILDDQISSLTPEDPLRLVIEKGSYSTGETAKVLILVDHPGRYVYFFDRAVAPLGLSKPKVIHMDTTSKVVALPLGNKPWEKGILRAAALTIVDGRQHIKSCTFPVISPELVAGQLQLVPGKTTYQPGEEVALTIKATDASGHGRPCSVMVTVYNKSLDLIANDIHAQSILQSLFSGWINCIKQSIWLPTPHEGSIYSIQPKWVMQLLKPMGHVPFGSLLGVSRGIGAGLACCFGEAASESDMPIHPNSPTFDLSAIQVREDFRDLAYWNATVETDTNGYANISFPMPDGLVEWKIMAWAMHTNYAASAETSVRCAKDFVLQLNPPRFMVEGDELELSASLRNHTDQSLDVRASCTESGNVIRIESPQTIHLPALAPHDQTLLYWNAHAITSGTSHITVAAQGTTHTDGMKKPIIVYPHGMLKRGGKGGVLAGNNNRQTIHIVIPQAIDPTSVELKLNCSTDLLDSLTGALPFLAKYPHECTEQTLNRFLSAITILQTMEQLGIDTPSADREKIIKHAQDGIKRLEEAKGYRGWGWNLDDSSPQDSLVTAWILRGLHMANKANGIQVNHNILPDQLRHLLDRMDEQMEPNAKGELKPIRDIDAMQALVVSEIGIEKKIRSSGTKEKDQATLAAFSIHLLAHAGELSLYGKILLANAFDLLGDTTHRDQIIHFIEQYLESDPKLGTYWLRTNPDGWWYWYNDPIETLAWYLKLLNRTEPKSEKTAGVVRYLMQNRIYGDHWKSTRDTAICIEALCEFSKNNHSPAPEASYQIALNGNPVETTSLLPGTNTLTFATQPGTPLFFDATWHYYTRENPIVAETCDLVTIARSYYRPRKDNDKKEKRIALAPGDTLKAGETIEVELTLVASQPLEYLLAEDFKPAGFETIDSTSGYSRGAYREFHNERVSFYLSHLRKGTTTLTYSIRAEHAGKVSALPATIELMYEPRQAANSAEKKFLTTR